MLTLVLPDGATREVPEGTLPRDVVGSIGPRLLMASVAVAVDGEIQDLMTPLRKGGAFVVITEKDPRALGVLRHSGAHILATAVRRLRPDAKIGFGPAIEDGFYYDFEVEKPFGPEDLEAFEAEMHKVCAEAYPFVREEVSQAEAKLRFVDDPLKLERLEDFEGSDEIISTYTDGPFIDLCKGPHIPDTSRLKHFKLLSAAGAYWRGDEKRQMLQRIYATAFFKKEELDAHLHQIEEARKRDHRVVGKALDLFMFHPYAPGAAFWTDRGTTIVNTLNDFLRELQADDYHEIRTPLLYNKGLWETSGHWGKYKENMFLVLDNESGEHDFSLKPMNCPSHYLMYAHKKHSYKELPLRYNTYDVLHRNEVSGALSGLTRVRQFQQDDCHIFLMESQIAEEVKRLTDFILAYYKTFGLTANLKFATRPETRVGTDEMWDNAESALKNALDATGLPYTLKPGDGAFYGPKIEYTLKDALGRQWQCGTMQVDFNTAERLGGEYVTDASARAHPVMLHRAIVGSLERFIGILIEQHAGALPVWLAPTQVVIANITDAQADYVAEIVKSLQKQGLRVQADLRNEKITYKIREHSLQKVPYILVVGDKEKANGTVAVRARGKQDLGVMALEDFLEKISADITQKT